MNTTESKGINSQIMARKYEVGDTWESNQGGIVYLMQKQKSGKANRIKRISPYINPNKANSKSNIPATKNKPKPQKRSRRVANTTTNWISQLNGNKDITAKPDPQGSVYVPNGQNAYGRVNTWKLKKTA